MGTTYGTIECACGGQARVNDTKTGGLSTICPECGAQQFYKSPKAVAGLRAKLLPAGERAAPVIGAGTGEPFDLTKL